MEERTQPFQQMSVKGGDVIGAGVEGPGVLRAAGRVNTILSLTKAGYNRRRVTRPRNRRLQCHHTGASVSLLSPF